MIELKNIDVTFQNGSHEFKAVDNVFKDQQRRDFGIVGPSGAGKSTLVCVDQFVTETNEWRSDY